MASHSDSAYLKTFALASTFYLGSAMATTTFLVFPPMLRPLLYKSQSQSQPPTPSITRPSSSLNVPQTPIESGRLTPTVSTRGFDFALALGSSGAYKAVAQQFSAMETAMFRVQVPLEFATIAAFGIVAHRARVAGNGIWTRWATAAALVAAIFPFTGALMAPLGHKVARIAGDEEKVEPYEDAPIDREAEKSNTVQFIKKFAALSIARTAIVLGAGLVGASAWMA
ncbi:hypothetical protein HII31_12554 [Pseudocercospora fuligena]|uniref:DUF1772-domain-containing protein n=1 Tax=Pseudocercospora fuligena TaxID=685502 RepID=A0A8H6R7S9_9PEZI|nr:hypothetical protein HII31_12554 [Pseudocercospora fuligena]